MYLPSPVFHPAFVKGDLIENFVNVPMRFFDFIEQHDGIGAAANSFGQHTALAIADISGRRPLSVETVCGSWNSLMLMQIRCSSPP